MITPPADVHPRPLGYGLTMTHISVGHVYGNGNVMEMEVSIYSHSIRLLPPIPVPAPFNGQGISDAWQWARLCIRGFRGFRGLRHCLCTFVALYTYTANVLRR